jgi:hypothetical protein
VDTLVEAVYVFFSNVRPVAVPGANAKWAQVLLRFFLH